MKQVATCPMGQATQSCPQRAWAAICEYLSRTQDVICARSFISGSLFGFGPPSAVRRLTSMPAEFFGIEKRGQVKEGYYADLLLMDPGAFSTEACFRDPERYPEGLDTVIINGTPVVEDGEPVPGALAGKVLRKNAQ